MWSNLRISTRLFALLGLVSALLVGVGLIGWSGVRQTSRDLAHVYDDSLVPMNQIAAIQALLLRNRLALAVALVTPDTPTITARTAEVQANIAEINRLWQDFTARALGATERALADEFARHRGRFVQEGLLPAVAALRAGEVQRANQIVVEAVRPLYAPVDTGIQALMKAELAAAQQLRADAQARTGFIQTLSLVSIAGGLLLAGVLGYLLVRSIAAALDEAVAAADAVAQGHLALAIRPRGRDEVAALMRALQRMQASLSGIVGGVRESAESVATASAQIAQGNQDLASRTEQQAASLEETAATMEQLSATVARNADAARQADVLAQRASQVATGAGEAVGGVVTTMRRIHEGARRIGEIIGLIDGIAAQTNILALNAAVEAARAGEAGRGFAVVAAEVRNLAQNSAESAREIASLVNASLEQMEQGLGHAESAGATMDQVVQAIHDVSGVVAGIRAAGEEQSTGIAQVTEAVGQMDRVTQQNAALVEEGAAAAASLRAQAQGLVQAVAVFTLAGVGAAPGLPHGLAAAPSSALDARA